MSWCWRVRRWWIFSGATFDVIPAMTLQRFDTARSYGRVPRWMAMVLVAALVLHAALRFLEPRSQAVAAALPPVPPLPVLRLMSLGEPQLASQALSLYLQAFDNQPGVSVPFAALDYARVGTWLDAALALDPAAQYPLVMASQLYASVNDAARQRAMCAWVHRQFLQSPDARWRWLAHCAIMVRHRLNDMPTALRYAEAITQHAGGASAWARQMHIFMLEDMGEVERATVLLGGLLARNEVSDPKEMHFLIEQLARLKRRVAPAPAPNPR